MLRRSALLFVRGTAVVLQGWGSSSSAGGWGGSSSSGGSGGGAGSSSAGGWGSSNASEGWGGSGGGGGGGWGSSGQQWGGDDGGWKGSRTGGRERGRGNFRQGRQQPPPQRRDRKRGGGGGWGNTSGGERDDGSGWGKPMTTDEDAWSAAPPSFTPPVRRVDPLSLTAVEVEIDGVKKLVGQRVQITGLADETTWHTLKDHLRQAGEVTFCRVFSSGRAVAEFTTPEDAARAIAELQASELEGATIFMREDREDTVLMNTRKKIREAREAQLRARKEEAEQARRELAKEQEGSAASSSSASSSSSSATPSSAA